MYMKIASEEELHHDLLFQCTTQLVYEVNKVVDSSRMSTVILSAGKNEHFATERNNLRAT